MTLRSEFIQDQDTLPNDGLAYTGEILFDDAGKGHYVIDLAATEAKFDRAVEARKKDTTLVMKASGGEFTAQVFPSGSETDIKWPYKAVEGDAIFVQGDLDACREYISTGVVPENLQGNLDIYVPDNAKHSPDGRLKYDDLAKEGYEIQGGTENATHTEAKVYSPRALMLFPPYTNTQAVVIKAEKEGAQHKWFPPGAAFKMLEGKISGINPDAVHTWEAAPAAEPQANPERNLSEPE